MKGGYPGMMFGKLHEIGCFVKHEKQRYGQDKFHQAYNQGHGFNGLNIFPFDNQERKSAYNREENKCA